MTRTKLKLKLKLKTKQISPPCLVGREWRRLCSVFFGFEFSGIIFWKCIFAA